MSKVSVIIPTYNRSHLLPRAVKSAQLAGSDVEVIVVDDASTDDTSQVCQSLAGIRYLRMGKNVGQAAARNAGIIASNSEYIAFLDDDDVRLPNSLINQCWTLDANPEAAFVYGRVLKGDQNCNSTGDYFHSIFPTGDIFLQLITTDFIPVNAFLVRKQSLINIGLFNPLLKGISEDWDLLLRLTEKYLAVAVDEPVAIYRMATATSGQATSEFEIFRQSIITTRARTLELPRIANGSVSYRRYVKRFINAYDSDQAIWAASDHLAKHEPDIAWELLIEGINKSPLRALRPWTLQLVVTSLWSTFRMSLSVNKS